MHLLADDSGHSHLNDVWGGVHPLFCRMPPPLCCPLPGDLATIHRITTTTTTTVNQVHLTKLSPTRRRFRTWKNATALPANVISFALCKSGRGEGTVLEEMVNVIMCVCVCCLLCAVQRVFFRFVSFRLLHIHHVRVYISRIMLHNYPLFY